jgi:hypothetical protein
MAMVERAFRESKIADLLAEPTTVSIPLRDLASDPAAATRAAEAAFPVSLTVRRRAPHAPPARHQPKSTKKGRRSVK